MAISFALPQETAERLRQQAAIFIADREKLKRLKDEYVFNYRSFQGNSLQREEYLREEYFDKAPNLSHLLFSEDGKTFYWNLSDIAVLMGRDKSSISRTLRKMEKMQNWRSRLYQWRKLVNPQIPVYVYSEDVFDLIVDFYEEEYLHRFVKPRRGNPSPAEERREIYRYWEYLKSISSDDKGVYSETGLTPDAIELPDIPPLSLKETVTRVAGRLFTIEMGAFFAVLIAICYELSRRWNVLYLWLPVLSFFLFIFCVVCIHRRKFNPRHLANIGAGALLFCLIWIAALLAGIEGHAPGRPGAPKLELEPSLGENALDFYIETEDIQNVEEFFYRIKPDTEYRSTGFMQKTNNTTGLSLPNTLILNEKHGLVEIDVKYTDLEGREQGPFSFELDTDQIEMDAVKYFVLHQAGEWIKIGPAVMLNRLLSGRVGNRIEKVMYGVNKQMPDTPIFLKYDKARVSRGLNPREILSDEKIRDVQYVSAQIFFADGTSTDVRIYQKQR